MVRSSTRAAVCLALLCGCSREPPAIVLAEQEVEEGPALFVQALRNVVLQRSPVPLWDALPPSWHEDVSGLTRQVAEKVDPQLWKRAFELAGQAARTYRARREFVFHSNLLVEPIAEEERARFDWLAEVVEMLALSPLATPEGMKDLDVRAFLAGDGARFLDRGMQHAATLMSEEYAASLRSMETARVVVLVQEGDEALVRISSEDRVEGEDRFVLVEGRWVPRSLLDGWRRTVPGLRRTLDSLDLGPRSEAIGHALDQMSTALAHLADADTQEKFDASTLELFAAWLPLALPAGSAPGR